jgi:MFS family permease
MVSLFLGLTVANVVGLVAALVLGYVARGDEGWRGYHLLAGVLAALLCIGVHCVVFTYFIATAKWVRHAVEVKHLDESLIAPTRSFKVMAFPAALLAMLAVFAAACLGAAHDAYGLARAWHHLAALGAVVVNVTAAAVELRAIGRNGRLIDDVLARVGVAELAGRS